MEGKKKPLDITVSKSSTKEYNKKIVRKNGATFSSENSEGDISPVQSKLQTNNTEQNFKNSGTMKDSKKSSSSTAASTKNSLQSSNKPLRKHKPKPRVTVGELDVDEPIPASPTKTSPLGTPRKIDYIIPAVITLTALPLLGITFYVLYKRGRDFWDKRHYRRMDFLINGMYNE